jgi:D-lactate dehydrogenase
LGADGKLRLINHLGIPLGDTPEEILTNLEQVNLDPDAVATSEAQASDTEYQHRVRDVDADTPARFNADRRRLHEASGCAGKLAVFAVRLDTFAEPNREQVFYVGTNDPTELTALRRCILTKFKGLPEMGEYMHRSYFDAADKYCKDTYLFIRFFGTAFLPRLFALKSRIDGYLSQLPLLPDNISDRVLQVMGSLWADHLPRRVREYRDLYEHHLMIKANDDVIEETRGCLRSLLGRSTSGDFFECSDKESIATQLHRFVAGGAPARYAIVHHKEVAGLMPLDIALPRNENDWHQLLADDVLEQLAGPFRLGHFLCMVFHWDFVVKKGVDIDSLKTRILALLDARGAKYPAEHNVGHLYQAEPDLRNSYQSLDPTNSFNAGIGKTSKLRHYA